MINNTYNNIPSDSSTTIQKLVKVINHVCQRRIPFIWRSVFAIIGAIIFTPPKNIITGILMKQPVKHNVRRYHIGGSKTICSSMEAHCANGACLQPPQQLSDISAAQSMLPNGTSMIGSANYRMLVSSEAEQMMPWLRPLPVEPHWSVESTSSMRLPISVL